MRSPEGLCDHPGCDNYIHVSDLARAHVLALDHLIAGGATIRLNLGSGKGHSIRDIVVGIEAMTGRSLPVRFGPRRAGDPPVLTADPSEAARVLGFSTELSGLATILRDAAPSFGVRQNDFA